MLLDLSKSLNYSLYFIITIKMTVSSTQFVSETFANFLLENANNGVDILSVLDDIVEGADTYL